MMKKLMIYMFLAFVSLGVKALDIPKGTFYFDNSLTKYKVVKFVYGSDSGSETFVKSMYLFSGDKWSLTFDEKIENMYRYTFADTSLPDGKISDTFSNVKEYISKTLVENRTATTDKAILIGGIFTPETGDNWAQGSWKTLGNAPSFSGTLPVLHINTEGNAVVSSTENYINATFWLDNMGDDSVDSIGSELNQLPMEIRGRGNYTWKDFDKKPYRIKFAEKASPLGMNKSKHFVLLAHADDNLGFLRNTVGFELSRRLRLDFTPAQEPVEVVLNGDYVGLYFLTENIRVAKDRVNITEQADYTVHPDSVTGGWIVEIDNYDETEQVRITEGNGQILRFTYKSPELLSAEQRAYLTDQVSSMNAAIYNADKSSVQWENLIDIDALARFYIVQEILDDAESFHGSCYLHKDIGQCKWKFGPVWDFGNSYRRTWQEFIYQNPPFGQSWIGEIAKFPRFHQHVVNVWKQFLGNDYAGLDDFIEDFCSKISAAARFDAMRWPNYGNYDMAASKNNFNVFLNKRIEWLISQWGEGESGIELNISNQDKSQVRYYNLQGVEVETPVPGLYIKVENGKATKVIVR